MSQPTKFTTEKLVSGSYHVKSIDKEDKFSIDTIKKFYGINNNTFML